MKTGWQSKPFDECIAKVKYTPKIPRQDFLDDGAFPIVSQEAEFINGYWNNEADLFKVSTPLVVFGDHTKVLKYIDFDFVLGADGVKILQPQDFLLPKFFYYQLQTAPLDSLGYARHYKLLKELQIAYPAKPEQHRIVAILDEAFAGIATARAAAEQNRQNARALFERQLQSVFSHLGEGWIEKPFEDCIENVKYTIKIQRKDFLEEGEFPIVSQEAEFINGYWKNAADVFNVATPVVLFGDHTKVLKYIDFDFVLGADGVKILSPKQFLHPKFFFYALKASPVKSLGYARHYRLLKDLLIRYPKTVLQQSTIADRLEQFSEETQRLEALYQRKLEALDELKQSLLHQAFSGQL